MTEWVELFGADAEQALLSISLYFSNNALCEACFFLGVGK